MQRIWKKVLLISLCFVLQPTLLSDCKSGYPCSSKTSLQKQRGVARFSHNPFNHHILIFGADQSVVISKGSNQTWKVFSVNSPNVLSGLIACESTLPKPNRLIFLYFLVIVDGVWLFHRRNRFSNVTLGSNPTELEINYTF